MLEFDLKVKREDHSTEIVLYAGDCRMYVPVVVLKPKSVENVSFDVLNVNVSLDVLSVIFNIVVFSYSRVKFE